MECGAIYMNKPVCDVLITEFEPPLQLPSNSAFMPDNTSSSQSCSGLSFHDLLLLALRTRDELIWTEFARRSQPVIAGVVSKTMRCWARPIPSLVDDLVQETYLKLFADNARALHKFVCHHENALYGFLKVVAFNVVHDHFRCAYSKKRGSGRCEQSIEPDGGINTIGEGRRSSEPVVSGRGSGRTNAACADVRKALENRILLHQVETLLMAQASLPTFSRDFSIFWLYYGDGLSAKAISRLPSVQLSVKGVESLLLRLTRSIHVKMTERRSRTARLVFEIV